MARQSNKGSLRILAGWLLLLLGVALVALGWLVPSRFKSVPIDVLKEAGADTEYIADTADSYLLENNVGVSSLLLEAMRLLDIPDDSGLELRLRATKEANALINRWGAWDPFLDAAFSDLPLEYYSDQPGALGIVLAKANRDSLSATLVNSRNPLVSEILSTGELTTYRRLFPVNSSAGRPLEATLLIVSLLAQEERFSPPVRREIRNRALQAKASGDASHLEDFYLDMLSLSRSLDWGQLKTLLSSFQELDTFSQLRYAFHRSADSLPIIYAASLLSSDPEGVMQYLGEFGDQGVETLGIAVAFGAGSVSLLVNEQLPLENLDRANEIADSSNALGSWLASFSLQRPYLSLSVKYALFFTGAFFAFLGSSRFSRFYGERSSPMLAYTQRVFVSFASLIVLIVISEPHLAGSSSEGYSFQFVMPVLAQEAGELVVIETTPSTSMDHTTMLSVGFFFLLQVLVFLICMLKVREINRQEVDDLVKLKLMENEENLFDAGLYVGIAGTCISLVLQVLGLIEANLLSAYASNLFGILCVAIVKIRLVRPYKNQLILASQDQLMMLTKKTAITG